MDVPFASGILLSLAVAVFARRSGLDRDRAFYPTVVIVVASYYVLFAAISGSVQVLLVESMVMAGFVTSAVMGFRSSRWIVAAALFGHGVFDAVHGTVIENTGMPMWWPSFCLAYDVGAAGWLVWFSRLPMRSVRPGSGDLGHLSSLVRHEQ